MAAILAPNDPRAKRSTLGHISEAEQIIIDINSQKQIVAAAGAMPPTPLSPETSTHGGPPLYIDSFPEASSSITSVGSRAAADRQWKVKQTVEANLAEASRRASRQNVRAPLDAELLRCVATV